MSLPWGDSPYDSKTPREVVDDYVLVRGDLPEGYAREQLADWIERYAEHKATPVCTRTAFCPVPGHFDCWDPGQ